MIELPFGLGARYKEDARDWNYRRGELVRSGGDINRPARVDNRHLFIKIPVWNQGKEGACTGMAMAAALSEIYGQELSPRFMFEAAKEHDEWPGEDYDGASVRGAAKAAVAVGCCTRAMWPFVPFQLGGKDPNSDTDARLHVLTSYERLSSLREILHAIWDIGYVAATVDVHTGWIKPTSKHRIRYNPRYITRGLHAILLVGYDEEAGYLLLRNSWDDWGDAGYAWLKFDDWLANGQDAWMVINEQT